ncbi:MAG TPA: 50S ribosomal protein L9 [Candidatus Polarisedimenticolaceae bacterium]|nr:50S ribosomal protein L9 [Candidatus Polarisedimenticolaceae bacterium]
MKIILREHVDRLGQRGEIVNVAAGFARNYLLPKGLAYLATPGKIKQLEQQRRVWHARDLKEQHEAEQVAARLAQLEIRIEHKAGEAGTLYGAVTAAEIASLLERNGVAIDRRKLELGGPIKSLGQHEIRVRLHPKVMGTFQVLVLPEDGKMPQTESVVEESEPAADGEDSE